MTQWYGAGEESGAELILGKGRPDAAKARIRVEPGTGDVQLQQLRRDGTWFTPAAEEYTMTAEDSYTLDQENSPPLKIIATGTARFQVFGVGT